MQLSFKTLVLAATVVAAVSGSVAQCPLAILPLNSITVDGVPGNDTPDDLVRTILGPGVTVLNVQFRGSRISAGVFTNGESTIGFDTGILLSSGSISNVPGPNTYTNVSTSLDLPGDPNLSALIANRPTFDATVLEFDFVPAGNLVSFQYVFASEEYNEYANNLFNDVFGFFVNGTNVALLAASSTGDLVVSINNVNGGNPPGVNAKNPQYYRDNTDGSICTELDGLTVVLNVQTTVIPNATNHIKLAIADTFDHIYDSAVFIKAGSFSVNRPPTITGPPPKFFPATCDETKRTLTAHVEDADGDALTVMWAVNGVSVLTNQVPTNSPIVSADLSLSSAFSAGTNVVVVTVSDGNASASHTTAIIVTQTDIDHPQFTMTVEPPARISVVVQDTESGLAELIVLVSNNCNVSIEPFTPGTTNPVLVVATKIDPLFASRLFLEAVDCAGNRGRDDPVITTIDVTNGGFASQLFEGIPAAERYVRVENGQPGLRSLEVIVNGQQRFKLEVLREGEIRGLDIGSALSGEENTCEIIGRGANRSSAFVMISDDPSERSRLKGNHEMYPFVWGRKVRTPR